MDKQAALRSLRQGIHKKCEKIRAYLHEQEVMHPVKSVVNVVVSAEAKLTN